MHTFSHICTCTCMCLHLQHWTYKIRMDLLFSSWYIFFNTGLAGNIGRICCQLQADPSVLHCQSQISEAQRQNTMQWHSLPCRNLKELVLTFSLRELPPLVSEGHAPVLCSSLICAKLQGSLEKGCQHTVHSLDHQHQTFPAEANAFYNHSSFKEPLDPKDF